MSVLAAPYSHLTQKYLIVEDVQLLDFADCLQCNFAAQVLCLKLLLKAAYSQLGLLFVLSDF